MALQNSTLFELEFKNARTGSILKLQINKPEKSTSDQPNNFWKCRYTAMRDGKLTTGMASGGDWLQSVLIALEIAAKPMRKNVKVWYTKDDIPAWVVIPKVIPISWGYGFYSKICEIVDTEERAINDCIVEKRHKKRLK